MSDIKKIKDDYLSKLDNDLNIEKVNQIKTELFGKNGMISNSFKTLGSLPNDERKKFASDLNLIKDELQEKILLELQDRLWKKLCSMPTETEEIKKEILNHYGLLGLTLG